MSETDWPIDLKKNLQYGRKTLESRDKDLVKLFLACWSVPLSLQGPGSRVLCVQTKLYEYFISRASERWSLFNKKNHQWTNWTRISKEQSRHKKNNFDKISTKIIQNESICVWIPFLNKFNTMKIIWIGWKMEKKAKKIFNWRP